MFFLPLLLRQLPPEAAHTVALLLLRIYQILLPLFPRPHPKASVSIRVPPRYALRFPSRLGLAAGFDKQAELCSAMSALGFGFVEVGTVTPLPQEGNPKPRIWRVKPQSLVNHLGFNSVGLVEFKKNLSRHRRRTQGPVFANVGKNKATSHEEALQDYRQCLEALESEVDGFVINISSPNTPHLRNLQSISFLQELASYVPQTKPTFIKLAPDLSDSEMTTLLEFLKQEPWLAGVVLTNTSRSLAEGRGFAFGGLSGPPLLARSLSCIERAASILKGEKIIIGVGGVSSLADAAQMRKKGADLIEIYTAFVYQGPRLVKEISSSLQ